MHEVEINTPVHIAPRVLTEAQAAAYINFSRDYLRQARQPGRRGTLTPGPSFIKKGRKVLYERAELDRWLDEGRR